MINYLPFFKIGHWPQDIFKMLSSGVRKNPVTYFASGVYKEYG